MKVFAVLVAGLAIAQGAVLPSQLSEDAVFDMFQSFLADPSLAEAFGSQRVKRSTWDKEFNFKRLGVSGGIKYKDASNHMMGGKAEVTVENIQKLVPNYPQPKKMQISIDADNFEKTDDDLFKMNVKYVVDNGQSNNMIVSRKKVGNAWATHIEHRGRIMNKEGEFIVNLKSDRENFLTLELTSEALGNFKFDGKVKNNKQVNADIVLNGRLYKMSGTWNRGKDLKLTMKDLRNKDVMRIFFDHVENDKTDMFEIDVGTELVPGVKAAGFKIKAVRDYVNHKESFDMSLNMNDKTMADLKLKAKFGNHGKMFVLEGKLAESLNTQTPRESKVAFKWSGGKNMKTKLEIVPCKQFGIKDLVVSVTRDADDKSRDWNVIISRSNEEMIKYNLNVAPRFGSEDYEMDVKSHFKLSSNSKLYPVFCTYGCWNERNLEATARVNKATPYKMVLHAVLKKDGENVLNFDFTTKSSPYQLIIKAPRLLPKILPSGKSSIEFKVDHNPGKKLSITSNTNSLSSLVLERLPNNDIKVILNGEEKITAGLKQKDNMLVQSTTLPDGRALTTTLKWKTKNLKQNTVDLILEGTERNLKANFDWGLSETWGYTDMFLNIDAKGNNKRLGDYKVERHIKCKVGKTMTANRFLRFSSKGESSIQNAPWPNPIKTDIELDLNPDSNEYIVRIIKNAGGVDWGITLTPGGEVRVHPSVSGLVNLAFQ